MAGAILTQLVRTQGYEIYAEGPIAYRKDDVMWRHADVRIECTEGAYILVLACLRILHIPPSIENLVGDMYLMFGNVTLLCRRRPGEEVSDRDTLKRIRRDFEAIDKGGVRVRFV